jgi:hypothetical protein
MKRAFLSFPLLLLCALGLWVAAVANVMAANPTELVVVSCMENNPGSGYSVINYDNSSGSPAQSSSDCATELNALLNAGLTKVSVTVQTYTTDGGYGAPGEVNGTYITYKVSGTPTSVTPPKKTYPWLPAVLQILLQ